MNVALPVLLTEELWQLRRQDQTFIYQLRMAKKVGKQTSS